MESKIKGIWTDEYGNSIIRSDRAVSEVVGSVLILSITVLAVTTILLYGVPNIQKLQNMAVVKNVEQTFTILDSHASRTSIGGSPIQTIDMNLDGGSLVVMPNGTGKESYMIISNDNNTFKIVQPMGKLRYRLEDRDISYEGGGVWSQYPSGATMLSPPEFHYNGQTLTLPIANIRGNASQGGKGVVTISFRKDSMNILYPVGGNKSNPLSYNQSGKILVDITSDYYDAWADYIRSLLYARVIDTNRTTRTVHVELSVVPKGFGGPNPITNPIKMRGLPRNDDPLKNFSFRVYPHPKSNGGLYPFNWDIRAKSGNKMLIFYIKMNPPNPAELIVGYQDYSVEPSLGETWGTTYYPLQTDDAGGKYIEINLLDKNVSLLYSNMTVGSTNSMSDPQNCRSPSGTAKITGVNDPALSWDGVFINTTVNNDKSLYNITEHYTSMVAQEGGAIFYQCSPNNGNQHEPDVPPSTLILDYDVTGDITYLYVSDNSVDVDIN